MERINVNQITNSMLLNSSKNGETIYAVYDGNSYNHGCDYSLSIDEDVKVNILLKNIKPNSSFVFNIKKGAELHLKGVLDGEYDTLKINADVAENGAIYAYFADFTLNKFKNISRINLNGNGSIAQFKAASLTAGNDDKEFEVSLYHIGQNTVGLVDNYGVTKDDGKLVFSGISKIEKNSKFTKTRQNAKIMVFDKLSHAIAKPILKIDENEVEASHGATVGKISDEQLFYLTSRGLREEQAKELITLGYLKPIMKGFEDDEEKELIETLIERRM